MRSQHDALFWFVFCAWCLGVAFYLALVAGLIWAVVHFVFKYW